MSRLILLCVLFAAVLTAQILQSQAPDATNRDEAKIAIALSIGLPGADSVEMRAAVVFTGDYAVAVITDDLASDDFDFSEGSVFDLSRLAYFDSAQEVWVDLKACKEWEKASIARTKQSLNKAPEEIRTAVQEMIEPNFKVQELPNGDLSISNSRLKYVVTPDKNVSKEMLKKYFDYDQLNAYHKAMTEKGFPPTPQLAVDEILSNRKLFPIELAATVWSPNGNVKMDATTRVEALDVDDEAEADIAIKKANQKKAKK